MKYDLNSAKTQVDNLDKLRIKRALDGATSTFQHIFQIIPLLLQVNHIKLPGYAENAPSGIADFELSSYQREYLEQQLNSHELAAIFADLQNKTDRTFDAILGLYVMGSIATVSQTYVSDLDIWVCHREDLSLDERERLMDKTDFLQEWAETQGLAINFYLMDQQRFRSFRYAEPLTAENCGSAQYMLLLDEFYRSAIRIAGKPLLWLHLLVEDEKNYESEVERLIVNKQINPEDWVDFGGLSAFSANEYFGASLWQLYKGIDSPYKSVIKILLLEAYSKEYPHTLLLSSEFKTRLLTEGATSYHFDAYLAMLERVTPKLLASKEFKRLDFLRRSFYIKATENMANQETNWRYAKLQALTKNWGWSEDVVAELNNRLFWKIKLVKKNHNKLIKFLMLSYRNLVNFARKYHVDAGIMPQDISILTRKLYAAFEELPGKVTLLNPQIAPDLSEKELTFIEVRNSRTFKDGWYMVNQKPQVEGFSQQRYIEYSEHLNKLVAWAYFNRILTPSTELHISSRSVTLDTLRQFATDLRLSLPYEVSPAGNEELSHSCELKNIVIAVNLVSDPTRFLPKPKSQILPSHLFSFGPREESLVGSIDLTYRNLWNEIRTLHFEGPNAILLALKVLSNKIHRGAASPQQVKVFCYSHFYQKTLRNIVTVLVNKCISIQLGDSVPPQNNLLRVAGKNWQFFFEERGISLQEIHNTELLNNPEFDTALESEIEDKETQQHVLTHRQYPYEIDLFAREGFLQFFFQDNIDGSFDVYILDENNHLEIYRNCDGEKEQKVLEINQIYQSSGLDGGNNPYKIVQRDFNYPQFYQLLNEEDGIRIVPFHSRSALS